MGYEGYVIGDSVISKEGLGHNLFSVAKFYDSDMEVAFRKHSCYVRDTYGVELIKGSLGSNLYTILVEDMLKSSPIYLLSIASKNKSWLWHRRLNHLNFGSVFLWEKAVATACYTQNRSLIHTRHKKTSYELVHEKKHDLTFLHVFGALCYPTNDCANLRKLQPTVDIRIFVDYAPIRKGYRIYNKRTLHIMETIHVQFDELTDPMALVQLGTGPAPSFFMPGQISSGLVPNLVPVAPPTADIRIFLGYAPSRKDYRIYNKRTRRIMETIHVKFDELTESMAHVHLSTRPAPIFLTPGQISSGLVPNPVPAAPYVPPTNKDMEILFRPMFDEYLKPHRVEIPVSPTPAVQVSVNLAGLPSSTTID
nr:integrase, catalytic region, zinc finger, CCHC-type, peptidase aspartic, catalytic [Tanacetum cinerariifolium]